MLKKSLPAIVAIILAFFAAYYFGNKGNEDQVKLLNKLDWLSLQNILYVEIMQRDANGKKVKIDTLSTIEKIKNLLSNADDKMVGGHNIPTGKWIVSVKLGDGSVEEFFATSYSEYEFNKNAVYMIEPSVESKIASKPVRVPDLESIFRNSIK